MISKDPGGFLLSVGGNQLDVKINKVLSYRFILIFSSLNEFWEKKKTRREAKIT